MGGPDGESTVRQSLAGLLTRAADSRSDPN